MLKTIAIAISIVISNFGLGQTLAEGQTNLDLNDTNQTQAPHIWNNWFISVGADAPSSESESKNKDIEITESNNDSSVISWNNLNSGVRAMYSDLTVKGVCWNGDSTKKHFFDGKNGIYDNGFNQLNLHADILFNASNLICDYQEQREWNLIPSSQFSHFALNGLNKTQNTPIDINLNIQGTFVGKHLNACNYLKNPKFSATLGFSFDTPDNQKEKVQIPIEDKRWNEHCNYMIKLNDKED